MKFSAVAKRQESSPLFTKVKVTAYLTARESQLMGMGKLPRIVDVGIMDGVDVPMARAFCRGISKVEVRWQDLTDDDRAAMAQIVAKYPANGSYTVEPLKKGGITPMPRKKTKKAKKKKR